MRRSVPVLLLVLSRFSVGAPQEPPAFRADTRLVEINVIVRGKAGPVTNLNQGDFVLTDQGKTRVISFFSAPAPAAASVQAVVQPLPANTFSSRETWK